MPVDLKPYSEGDEKKIIELFSLAYPGREMSESYWNWRFKDNPSGTGIISLAWADDVLTAHYAVTSSRMSIGGKVWVTAFSGTTMTHPSYRRKGLFMALGRKTYEELSVRGVRLVWGFPNSLSHRGFIRELAWQDIYEIPTLRLKLTVPADGFFIEQRNDAREFAEVDQRFDRLWERVYESYDIIVQRDASHIRWRYFSNPAEKYRLIALAENREIRGYAVFKRYQDELQVVDLLTDKEDTETGLALIRYIVVEASLKNAKSVGLWLNSTHPLHQLLERLGFKPEGPVTYFAGLALDARVDRSVYDFRRWYFTMGDSDVF